MDDLLSWEPIRGCWSPRKKRVGLTTSLRTTKKIITGVTLMNIGYILLMCLALAVIGDAFLLSHNRNGEDDWADFRDAHHCTPLMETDGSNRAGYRCDDGKVHYRWRQMR